MLITRARLYDENGNYLKNLGIKDLNLRYFRKALVNDHVVPCYNARGPLPEYYDVITDEHAVNSSFERANYYVMNGQTLKGLIDVLLSRRIQFLQAAKPEDMTYDVIANPNGSMEININIYKTMKRTFHEDELKARIRDIKSIFEEIYPEFMNFYPTIWWNGDEIPMSFILPDVYVVKVDSLFIVDQLCGNW